MDTTEMILEKVAPIFNKKGYVGTSMSDITKAINLTKGAIYCNFKNKEDLAVKAFLHNYNMIISPLNQKVKNKKTNLDKLRAISEYYKTYYKLSSQIGGCPLLKVGNDTKYNNPLLFKVAKNNSLQLMKNLERILENGKIAGEFIKTIDPKTLSQNIFSMIEGGIFMAITFDNEDYLLNILKHIDNTIFNSIIDN